MASFSFLKALSKISGSHPRGVVALREKSLASDYRSGRWRRIRRYLLGGIALEGPYVAACSCFSCRRCSGCRGGGPERLCLYAEAAASGSIAGGSLRGRAASRHDMGGSAVPLVRRSCRLGQRVGWIFMSGRRPRMGWCDGRGLQPVALCSLGYGLTVCAALQLESERWYVGAAAPNELV
jgi:hypothetical protein